MYTQLTFHSQGRFAWQPAGGDIGAFVRTLARIVGSRMLAFGLADQHGHVIVEAPDALALGHIRTNLLRAKPFAGAVAPEIHASKVEDRDHLAILLSYMARQAYHHRVSCDWALWAGSSAQDMLGARCVPGLVGSAGAALPDVNLVETMLRALGLVGPLCPASDAEIVEAGAAATWRACVDALALAPDETATDLALAGRRAYCALTSAVGMRPAEARDAAQLSRPAWYRMLDGTPDPEVLRAVRTRLGLVRLAAAQPAHTRVMPEKTPPPVLLAPRRRR